MNFCRLFLTVMPWPYQRQLFAAMAEQGMDLQVRYFTGGAHDREWGLPELAPFEKVVAGRTRMRLEPSAHWNPCVMAKIEAARPDLVVASDYSAPTAQVAMRGYTRRRIPFVLWGEVPGFSQRGPLGAFLRRRLQASMGQAEAIAGSARYDRFGGSKS